MLQRAPRTASQPSAGNPRPHAVTSPGQPGPPLSFRLSLSSSGGQNWRGNVLGLRLGRLYVGISGVGGTVDAKAALQGLA